MNYLKIYDSIINKSLQRQILSTIYTEDHHIIPRCVDKLSKITTPLFAKEHFICHHLLTKIYPKNKKLKQAFWLMCQKIVNKREYRVTARVYNKIKAEISVINSKLHKGKVLSEKTKLKISKSKIGIPRSIETKEKLRIANLGKVGGMKGKVARNKGIPRTKELKDKLSKMFKGRKVDDILRDKIRKSVLANEYHHSDEVKERIRLANLKIQEEKRLAKLSILDNKEKEI